MKNKYEIIIAGGGLAGLINAIDLAKAGHSVLVLEKDNYPVHKVCGEYISNEVRPYLESLQAFPHDMKPVSIKQFKISSPNGTLASCDMSMGGFGISRYTFDDYLFRLAKSYGAEVMQSTAVKKISFKEDQFEVLTDENKVYVAKVVIGSFGKRSRLDKVLNREFIGNRTSYIGIKHHFDADFPKDTVALHNFKGGYCGLSAVENNKVNLCYLTTTQEFNKYKGIEEFEQQHLIKNPHLRDFFKRAKPLFKAPLVISQINFDRKEIIKDHILMSGDAAGLIHPLCGNGMAMAIHSAKLCASQVKLFLKEKISRSDMEWNYTIEWEHNFEARLKFGQRVQRLFGKPIISEFAVKTASLFPGLLRSTVRLSHGKEITS